MDVRIKFLGAAQSVTGSKYLLEIGSYRLLIDCGLFQGEKKLRLRNWDSLPLDISTIDAVILTHAHIDHSGYLPRLVKDGYRGAVHCTEATQALLEIMLRDAAKLQMEEAEFARKHHYSKHKNPQPIFNTDDAELALSLLIPHPYLTTLRLNETITCRFINAGHILGSSIVEIIIKGNRETKKIVFSGDLGRSNQPILESPALVKEADVLLIESTYGNRENDIEHLADTFAQVIRQALDANGCLLIPSFAVGRTQLLLYYLHQLMEQGAIPKVPVYIDSPMAISATSIYQAFPDYHKLDNQRLTQNLFDYPHFHYYTNQKASVDLNQVRREAIIISASGMCTGGRILHHLFHRLPRPADTLLFVGYQARGTRGRKLLDGETRTSIFGLEVTVNCRVVQLPGLSAHADRSELLQWARNIKKAPKITFVTHGEKESAQALAQGLNTELGWPNVQVPDYLESVHLFEGI